MKKDTLVIIPVYNEEQEICKFKFSENYDVLFVADGCSDNTENLLKKSKYRYLKNEYNQGITYCIKSVVPYVNEYRYVITMDGDGQHPVEAIEKFIECLQTGVQFVTGMRKLYDFENVPTSKICSNFAAAYAVYKCTGVFIADVTCGFKGFTREYFKEVVKNVDDMEFSFPLESILYSIKNNILFKTLELPALYFANQIWATSNKELRAFYKCLGKLYPQDPLLNDFQKFVFDHKSELCVDELSFYQFYFKDCDCSLIQCNLADIKMFLQKHFWGIQTIEGHTEKNL